MTQLDKESGGAYPHGHQNHGAPAFWMVLPDEDVDDPRPTSNVPASQFFSEGNGGEFRCACFIEKVIRLMTCDEYLG